MLKACFSLGERLCGGSAGVGGVVGFNEEFLLVVRGRRRVSACARIYTTEPSVTGGKTGLGPTWGEKDRNSLLGYPCKATP